MLSLSRQGSFLATALLASASWSSLGLVSAATVEYDFVLHPRRSNTAARSPDCFNARDMILVNDMMPGPTIKAYVGDTIVVRVTNMHPSEASTIHYHGLLMKGQAYQDGSATVSACSVGPMQSQVQTFVAANSGTHYWHSHISLARSDGIQGAIIIYDNKLDAQQIPPYDDERIIFLEDWYHTYGTSRRNGLDSEPFVFVGTAPAFLINGKGLDPVCDTNPTGYVADPAVNVSSVCVRRCGKTDSYSVIKVDAGKTYRLRLINAANLYAINFAIAGHSLTVVEADGVPVEPFTVDNLDITTAQRYSVLLNTDQEPGTYIIQTITRHRSGPKGQAFLQYGNSTTIVTNSTGSVLLPTHPAVDDRLAGPALDAKLFTKNASYWKNEYKALTKSVTRHMIVVGTQQRRFSDNLLRWAANNVSQTFSADPIINMAYKAVQKKGAKWPATHVPGTITVPDMPNITWDYATSIANATFRFLGPDGHAIVKLKYGDVVELVLQNTLALNGVAEYHAWHLHGHAFWVVGQGNGTYDPNTDRAKFNLKNPVLRDVVSLWPTGWTAIRFIADNPGAWPFHCTINPHSVMGMGFTFVVSPDMLDAPPDGVFSCTLTSLDTNPSKKKKGSMGKSSNYGGTRRIQDI